MRLVCAFVALSAPHANLAEVSVEDGWVVVAEPLGPEVGRIAGPIAPVAGLRRCPPIRATRIYLQEQSVETVANGDLYAVVRAGCLGRRPKQAQFVVRVRLGTRKLHVVGKVPSGAISLAAAGSRLALTYNVGRGNRVRVDVVDSRNARPLHRLITPPGEAEASYGETMIDATGDVLVAGNPRPNRGPILVLRKQAWWGNSRTRVAHPLRARFGASLSEGHIAYVPSGEGEGERIDVLNLATGSTRTAVTFSGSVNLEGFGLGGNTLAWAQRSYAYKLVTFDYPSGQQAYTCVGLSPVGYTELTETPLSASGAPITVSTSPGLRPAGESCPIPI